MQGSVLQRGDRLVDLQGVCDMLGALYFQAVTPETANANRIEASWAADSKGEHALVRAELGGAEQRTRGTAE